MARGRSATGSSRSSAPAADRPSDLRTAAGDWIAVSWSWSQTNGHPSASLQKYPTSCEPSHASSRGTAAGEEGVARLDDAELVALGGQRAPRARPRVPGRCRGVGRRARAPGPPSTLVVEGGARQVEVDLVRAGLLPLGRLEPDAEPGVITRQQLSGRSSANSRSSTPAQKRARRLGSFASMQRATR
jgi:hypothetical protein